MATAREKAGESEARSYGRRASLLSIGVGITGLITYLYFAIASHELSKDQYGAGRRALGRRVHRRLGPAAAGRAAPLADRLREPRPRHADRPHRPGRRHDPALGRASPSTSSRWRCATPIQDNLLHGNSTLYWIGVAAVTAYGASYFARGFLAGSHRLTIYALLIISESVARTAFPAAVALGIASGQTAVAMGIVAAPTLSLIVVPFAFLRSFGGGAAAAEAAAAEAAGDAPEGAPGERRPEGASPGDAAVETPTDEFTLARGGRFAGGVFLIMLSEQTFLNAGQPPGQRPGRGRRGRLHLQRPDDRPGAAAALSGGPDEPPPPPHHAWLARASEDDFRASVRVTILAIAGFAALVALAMLVAGPRADADRLRQQAQLRAARPGDRQHRHGRSTSRRRRSTRRRSRRARSAGLRICWLGCAVAFVVWVVVPIVANDVPPGRDSATWVPRPLLCSLLYWLYRQPLAPKDIRVEPGSTEEMELQLASADEACPRLARAEGEAEDWRPPRTR